MRTRSLAAVLFLSACVGSAPNITGGGPDAGDAPDAGTVPDVNVHVSGTAMDYFTNLALDNVALSTDGMTPPATATSGVDGSYTLSEVPPGSIFYVDATRANYRPTRNDMVTVADTDVTAIGQYAVSSADTNRQYASVGGLVPTVGTSVLFADLVMNNGSPFAGLPLTAIKLTDSAGAPLATPALGPYFFGAAGDLVDNATLSVSTAYGTPPRARVGFLDVPVGDWTLEVDYTTGQGTPATYKIPFHSAADGAALATTAGQGGGGGGGGGGGAATFTATIYPMLQKAANGGLGCANCHTAGGQNANMQFDLPAATVYTNLMAASGDIVVATPASSKLLTMPLYETPPNHPNATFASTLDPNYITIMNWITAGAPQ